MQTSSALRYLVHRRIRRVLLRFWAPDLPGHPLRTEVCRNVDLDPFLETSREKLQVKVLRVLGSCFRTTFLQTALSSAERSGEDRSKSALDRIDDAIRSPVFRLAVAPGSLRFEW